MYIVSWAARQWPNCIITTKKYLARKEKRKRNKINKSDIVKYVGVQKSPCITVARHGLGEFSKKGQYFAVKQEAFVNLLRKI